MQPVLVIHLWLSDWGYH